MLKWLLVVVVVAGVYFFFIKKKPLSATGVKQDKQESDEMVECAECGTYCSVDDAFIKESRFYCSKECMKGQ